MSWYAINVAIAYFSAEFGPEMYAKLLFAYNVSATLLVLGQATLDKQLIEMFGVRRLFFIRVNVALVSIVAISMVLPFVPEYNRGTRGETVVRLSANLFTQHTMAAPPNPLSAGYLPSRCSFWCSF